jgi:hypothetical protein
MKIRGFRLARYAEWWRVLKTEGKRLTVGDWYGLVKLALKGFIKKKEKGVGFSGKMLGCYRCPLFDRGLKKCGDGKSGVGCGCYMPFKVAMGGGCWAHQVGVAKIKEWGVGWR